MKKDFLTPTFVVTLFDAQNNCFAVSGEAYRVDRDWGSDFPLLEEVFYE